MKNEILTLPLARTCRLCKQQIFVTVFKDENGYFVSETCECASKGFPPRKHSCEIPEYANELKNRIKTSSAILEEISKYT